MSFEIREATSEDAPTIVELVVELCAFEGKTRDQVEITEDIVLRDGFGESPSFKCFPYSECSFTTLLPVSKFENSSLRA